MIPPITDTLIADIVQTKAMVAAGHAYWRQGRVSALVIDTRPDLITAQVKGNAKQPYSVHIAFPDGTKGNLKPGAVCTCPVGIGCKHAAAVLLAAANLRSSLPPPSSHQPPIIPVAVAQRVVLPVPLQQWLTETQNETSAAQQATLEAAYVFSQRGLHVGKSGKGKLSPGARQGLPHRVLIAVWLRAHDGPAQRGPGATGAGTAQWSEAKVHQMQYGKIQLDPTDRWLVRRMDPYSGDIDTNGTPKGLGGGDWIEKVVATGRARWRKVDGPILHWGDDQTSKWCWVNLPNATQRLVLDGLTPGQILLVTAPPIIVDEATGMLHRVACDTDAVLAQRLLLMPPMTPDVVPQMAQDWPAIAGPDVPAPALAHVRELGLIQPTPVLTLTQIAVDAWVSSRRGRYTSYSFSMQKHDIAVARMTFDYAGHVITPTIVPDEIICNDVLGGAGGQAESLAGAMMRFTRDNTAESAAFMRLVDQDLLPLDAFDDLQAKPANDWDFAPDSQAQADDFAEFMQTALPHLRTLGWRIEFGPKWPLAVAEVSATDLEFDVSPSGTDWFDISLGARIGGSVIDILPGLRQLLARGGPDVLEQAGDSITVALGPGQLAQVPTEQIRPVLTMLLQMALQERHGSGTLRLAKSDIAVLAELEQGSSAHIGWRGGDGLRQLARALTRIDTAPTATPANFKASLRPYQQQGLDWLQALHTAGFGGVLADDMGLGKTVQALAHIATLKAAGKLDAPVLIICPTSVLPNWQAEIAKFTPDLAAVLWHGNDRQGQRVGLGKADIILSSYPLLLREHQLFAEQKPALILFDEAHTLKNPKTAGFKAAKMLKAGQIIALSGTPVENQLTDVWSLMDLTVPNLLGTLDQFKRTIDRPITRDDDSTAKAVLRRRLRPFMLRRTKDEVARDLPEKTEIPEWIDLEKNQQASYESLRLLMQQRVRDEIARVGLLRSQIVFLDALLKLRQVCCDPRLVPQLAGKEAGSAKLARLMEMLPELQREGRRVLLFSQFTSMLDLIKPELDALHIAYVEIRGETQDRTTPVQRFQAGDVPLILVSLKAGGTGLNLTAADTVILYDPWWNPAVEAQAIDRAHRIGQTKPVFVHRLIAKGTIEEKILGLQDKKRALADMLWDGDSASPAKLTEADVAFLLG